MYGVVYKRSESAICTLRFAVLGFAGRGPFDRGAGSCAYAGPNGDGKHSGLRKGRLRGRHSGRHRHGKNGRAASHQNHADKCRGILQSLIPTARKV